MVTVWYMALEICTADITPFYLISRLVHNLISTALLCLTCKWSGAMVSNLPYLNNCGLPRENS